MNIKTVNDTETLPLPQIIVDWLERSKVTNIVYYFLRWDVNDSLIQSVISSCHCEPHQ